MKHDQTDKTRNVHGADGFVSHKPCVPVNVPEKSDTLIKSTPHHNKRETQANTKPKEHYHHPCNDEREKWNDSNDYGMQYFNAYVACFVIFIFCV